MNLVFLHGFWGRPENWSAVTQGLRGQGTFKSWLVDLYREPKLSPRHNFTLWSENFCQEIRGRFGPEPVYLVGYSLGGRLGLHAMLFDPQLFCGALLLSTHPGFLTPQESEQRLNWEKKWAEAFREESWERLVCQWQGQEVFTGSKVESPPTEVDRERLASSFESWSLTRHEFGLADLKSLSVPLQWWVGGLDSKFVSLQKTWQGLGVPGQMRVISGVGHRIPADAPQQIQKALLQWVQN